MRVLTEVFGYGNSNHEELDQICDLFERELERFFLAMLPVMAWILIWRRNYASAILSNIDMGSLFSFNEGVLKIIENPKGKANIAEYIHYQCKQKYDPTINLNYTEAELISKNNYKKFIRGKYLFWFLVSFCGSIKKKMNVEISPKNGMTIIGNHARMPDSLRQFTNDTYCTYISK